MYIIYLNKSYRIKNKVDSVRTVAYSSLAIQKGKSTYFRFIAIDRVYEC